TESYSATVPAGEVMSQTPAAGTEVLPGAAVDIEVSLGPAPVAVPNVVGLTQSAAEAALAGAGLTLGAVTESYSATVPAGEVMSQTPVAGAEVALGTAVAIEVSLGPAPVAVPYVVGLTRAAAESALAGAGLTLGAVTESYSATVPAGAVIGQTPVAGTEVAPGTAVALEVSLGPDPAGDQPVPNVAGLTRAEAEAALAAAGFTLGTVTEVYNEMLAAGLVTDQNPPAGSPLAPGTAVNLVLSKGPAPILVPNVVGLARASAEGAIVAARLAIGTVTEEYSTTFPAGRVISQSPLGGVESAVGSPVNLVVSKGPRSTAVEIPDVTGLARPAAEAALTSAGFMVGAVTEEYSGVVAAGAVARQNPPGRVLAEPGTAVSLSVSLGVDPQASGTARDLLAEVFEDLDADGSGGLSLAEARARIWNMTPLMFAALDANGDGVLDRDELELGGCGGCAGCGKAGLSADSLKSRLGDLFLGALSLLALGAVSRVRRF
ncbi:MAG TPA: PASTA domain-containing protein, partial [Candidatus Hydrogenedentes bacterium]|nr:PASTA domain-containing protein [Candidatus Hydrogenedentota bacterium]